MKPAQRGKFHGYSALTLYRDDLEEIIRIFNPNKNEGVISLSDDDYEYDSLDELKSCKGVKVNQLAISQSVRAIRLALGSDGSYLHLIQPTAESEIAFYKAHEYLKSKEGWSWIPSPVEQALYTFIFAGLAVVSVIAGIKKNHIYFVAAVPAFFLGMWLFARPQRGNRPVIRLVNRADAPSFFRRKKDELVLLIVGALLGAVATLLATLLVNHLHH